MDYEEYVNFTKEELIAEILSVKKLNYLLSLRYFYQEESKYELVKKYNQLLQLVKDHYSKFIQEELELDAKYSASLKEQELNLKEKIKNAMVEKNEIKKV